MGGSFRRKIDCGSHFCSVVLGRFCFKKLLSLQKKNWWTSSVMLCRSLYSPCDGIIFHIFKRVLPKGRYHNLRVITFRFVNLPGGGVTQHGETEPGSFFGLFKHFSFLGHVEFRPPPANMDHTLFMRSILVCTAVFVLQELGRVPTDHGNRGKFCLFFSQGNQGKTGFSASVRGKCFK